MILSDAMKKEALTRAVTEWRKAQEAGQQGTADTIAKGYGQLGLKPRYLENISGGGLEAGVDKMMGRAMGPISNRSGYIAQKLYKPDSPLTTGKDTTNLLREKQYYTQAARNLSPEAKSMVPAMHGFREIQGPGGELRHMSQHEFVQGGEMIGRVPAATGLAQTQRLHEAVVQPLAKKGLPMGDISRIHEGQLAGNTGNVLSTPTGPKLIDFLPHSKSSPVSVVQQGSNDLAIPASSGGGRLDTMYGDHNMNQLRQEVFRPGSSHPALAPTIRPPPPAAPIAKTVAGSLAKPMQTAVTKIEGKLAPAATSLAGRAPKPISGALSHLHV
jgi:hypothetical protein